MTTTTKSLTLNFQGRIIEHLGLQMYQSPVSAIAEMVANAWDADATEVNITLPDALGRDAMLVVADNGIGMTYQECQDRFLNVGYDTRDGVADARTDRDRPVLGRKGIGKFAGFGIAMLIEVDTISGQTGERTVFELDQDKLTQEKKQANDETTIKLLNYTPPNEEMKAKQGTTIRLKHLSITVKRKPSPDPFRQSMARRFTLHERANDFKVFVNGIALPFSEDLEKAEFVFPRDYNASNRPESLKEEDGWGIERLSDGNEIKWRFVFYPDPIEEQELRGVSIFAKGKVAQSPFIFNLTGGLGGQHGLEYLSGLTHGIGKASQGEGLQLLRTNLV